VSTRKNTVWRTLALGRRVALGVVLLLLEPVCAVEAADETGSGKAGFVYQSRRTKQPMSQDRHRHVTVNCGQGRIAVFAGYARRDVQVFDVRTETFLLLKCIRGFGDFNGIFLGENRSLLVDGRQDCVFDLTTTEFTPTENTFTGKGVRWPEMVPLPDGRIFLCGGFDDLFKVVDDCAVFDAKARRFTPVGKLCQPRARATATRIANDRILIAGGCDSGDNASLDTLEIFDLSTGKSRVLDAKLKESRSAHGAVALSDGTVLLAGGAHRDLRTAEVLGGGHRDLRTAEVFDPRTGTMTPVGSMGVERFGCQTAVLPSGRVAVFGGRVDIRVVEVYDPTKRVFVVADQLLVDARACGFTATRLEDGRVLLVGGRVNDHGDELATAEIFTETEVSLRADLRSDVDDLVRQLGHAQYAVRETATRKLIEKGPDIAAELRPLLKHDDPEIRVRAGEILKALSGGGNTPKWCVEVWKDTRKLTTLWFNDCSCPKSKEDDDRRVLEVGGTADEQKATHLVVRFPPGISYELKVNLLNMIGWSRVSVIYLGGTL
jgi:hypothetical protein